MSRAGTTAREQELPGFTCARMLRIAIAVAVVLVSQLQVGTALAANPVTDLTVTQNEGYATLAWTPVATASDYQVERTVVNADGSLGTATIVGVWQAQRTITPALPKFADAGFALGGTYQWRVRARFGTTPQDYSAPVVQDDTAAMGHRPRRLAANAVGDEWQRDVHHVRQRAHLHRGARCRQQSRAHGRARPHESGGERQCGPR